MTRDTMPIVDVTQFAHWSEWDRSLIALIVASKGKNAGRLRASGPKVEAIGHELVQNRWEDTPSERVLYNQRQAEARYVWRMVAFLVSPHARHQCMPVCEGWALRGTYDERRAREQELDVLVREIVDRMHPREWHGVRRWGQALGQVGEPVVREGGTIVYR